jgi:predicted phosphodiesterase
MLLLLLTGAVALLALSAPVLNFFYRNGYVFIDHETKRPGLARFIFYCLMLPNAAGACACFAAALRRGRLGLAWIGFGVSAVFSLFFLAINLVSGKLTDNETIKALWPEWRFRFTCPPVVFDVGGGYYSIVFAASRRCQGSVTYSCHGEEKTVFCIDGGVRRAARLHSVLVRREELENTTYLVCARRVWERLSYGGRWGKTISSESYAFQGSRELEAPAALALSDWHFHGKPMERAAKQFARPHDLLLVNGDSVQYSATEARFVRSLLLPLAHISQGAVPVIITRGNHEVRADFDNGDFWRKIGLQNGWYYQTQRGRFLFTAVDSAEHAGEDWEHPSCYDMDTHLARVLDWLEALPPQPEKYNILLLHDKYFSGNEEMQKRFFAAARRMGVLLSVSGHSHSNTISPCGDHVDVQDGGLRDIKASKSLFDIFTRPIRGYNATQLVFDSNSNSAHVEFRNELGELLGEETILREGFQDEEVHT